MLNDQVVFIGGVGGSGTRAVAEVVSTLGVFLGNNLNGALDNLDWPGGQCASVIRDRSRSYEDKFPEISDAFINFSKKMTAESDNKDAHKITWGTKVPGSFYYLRYLSNIYKNMRYIHVIRHGLDMAYSGNHNQLFNWGGFFDIVPEDGATPRQLLKYWACANNFAIQNCHTFLPNQHLLIKFEDLCSNRAEHVQRIADFLDIKDVSSATAEIQKKIVRQKTQGRYKGEAQAEMFDESDIAVLKKLGFSADFQ
jgi:hypothetical protein